VNFDLISLLSFGAIPFKLYRQQFSPGTCGQRQVRTTRGTLADSCVRRQATLFYNPGYRFQAPFGTAARAVPAAVQCRCDSAKGVALATQIPNLLQRPLLGRVGFKMSVVRR